MMWGAKLRALNDWLTSRMAARIWRRDGIPSDTEGLSRALRNARNGKFTGMSRIDFLLCKYTRRYFKMEMDDITRAIQVPLFIATLAIGAMLPLLSGLLRLWR